MFQQTLHQMGFWLTWLIIPFVFEAIPTLASCLHLLLSKRPTDAKLPDFLPQLTVIVPVLNSEDTLARCLKSIAASDYPTDHLLVFVVDNGSTDSSFQVFAKCQEELTDLRMNWLTAPAGKAAALNAAIYQSNSPFVVNIDSDGRLEKHALSRVIAEFNADPDLDALTGTVLTDHALIKKPRRLLKLNEYFEYCQVFLAGRNIENETGELFTLSGAFSAFRRTTLVQSFLYSTTTLSEDTEMTFQIRYRLRGKPGFCPHAIFYTAPIEGFGKLYTQRQRWQRGEMEVVQTYLGGQLSLRNFFKSFQVRRLLVDHTVNLIKTIWLGAAIILPAFGYSLRSLLLSYFLIYCMYLLLEFATSICVISYMKPFPEERHYYLTHLWLAFLQPFHNLLCSLIRCVGIINFYTARASWRGPGFGQELGKIARVIKQDCKLVFRRRHYDD